MKKKIFIIFGILASLFCITGGILVIAAIYQITDNPWLGLGIYFIGKGLFVGPMLISNLKD